ncbi:MAG: M60 family metallopeptidase [Phycisphaerales bacterium]
MRILASIVLGLICIAHADGADAIATGGNPASVIVWGDAEPVAAIADGTVLSARTRLGNGRVVALGHGGFLRDDRGDTRAFIAEQLAWLADEKPVRAWGVPDPIADLLASRDIAVERVGGSEKDLDFNTVDLIVGSAQAFHRASRFDDLARWIDAGGTMLCVETAWGQLQLGHADSVDDLAANRLLSGAGIMYTDRALSPGRDGLYELDNSILALTNADFAMRILAGEAEGDKALAARVVRGGLAIAPLDGPLIRAADALADRYRQQLDDAYANMADRPLRLNQQPLACALLDLEARRAKSGDVRAHPSAVAFPGPVPVDMPRITRRITLDAIPGWRSTGLYAAPGEPVTVRVIDGATAGSAVQIGAWRDPQDFDDRVRMPKAIFRTALNADQTTLASPIGGPIYLDLDPETARAGLTVEISGAVEMPRFRLGHTTVEEWQSRLRSLPVAWAELESDELVFTIPASAVRELDRPDLVMEHWNKVHEAMQEMEPRSPRHWPDRQQRYVAEKRLSWGYMYCPSDGPLVIPMTAADEMVALANFDAEGENQLWGHYHEMGHSHQNPMWTFSGTGEVTVNIFTVLALHTVNGYPLDDAAMRTEPARAFATMVTHAKEGAPFDKWKRDPFLALQTYALLWQEFGWEAFRTAFRAYDDLAPGERPSTDDEKRDRFAITMSQTVERNLAPYFEAWGIPISGAVEEAVGDLPVWMPEGWDEYN